MNASYPSFLSENAHRAFPFVVNPLSSGVDNSWILNLKGFSRRSLLDNVNLYKIFVYPSTANQLTGQYLSAENVNLQNAGHIQPGYVSLIFEVHKAATIIDRTVSVKIPISNTNWPYNAISNKIEDEIKIYEIKCLISKEFFEGLSLDNFSSINSILYLEPSLIFPIANVVVDKLSIVDPNKILQSGNLLISSNDSLISGQYLLGETFNEKPQYLGPNDFCIRWKIDPLPRWSLSKKTTDTGDYYFSADNTNTPDSVISWSIGSNGTAQNIITVSRENITPERSIRDEVKFYPGINTEVRQLREEILINSTLSYGLGQAIYTGKDSGICNGIININGVRPNNSRTFLLKGGEGISIENRPEDHTIVIKVNRDHAAAKCPPFLKVTDATLISEQSNPLVPDMISYFALFKIVLTSEWSSPILINYETVGDSATANIHFEETSGSITLSPGQKISEVKVPILFGNFPQNQELKFFLDIESNSGVYISNSSGEAAFKRPNNFAI